MHFAAQADQPTPLPKPKQKPASKLEEHKRQEKQQQEELKRHFEEAVGEGSPELEEPGWLNNFGHWVFGGGEDMHVSIEDVYPEGLDPDFKEEKHLGYETGGPLGGVVLQKEADGSITIDKDKWDFNKRKFGQRDDPNAWYNKHLEIYPEERATRGMLWLHNNIGLGEDYDVYIHGRIPPKGK